MYSSPNLEPVCCSMSSSNCYLTYIQISQEAGKVVWIPISLKTFQFVVIHKSKALAYSMQQMFFWHSLAFSMIQWILAFWSLVPLPFLNPAWTSGGSRLTYCWSLAWRILSITLLVCEMGKQWKLSDYFFGYKITADGDCNHEIKRHSLEGKLWPT